MKFFTLPILVLLLTCTFLSGQPPTAYPDTIWATPGKITLGQLKASGSTPIDFLLIPNTGPSEGEVILCSDGSFSYEAAQQTNHSLLTFRFQAKNSIDTNTATITIRIIPINITNQNPQFQCDELDFPCDPPAVCKVVSSKQSLQISNTKNPNNTIVLIETPSNSGTVKLGLGTSTEYHPINKPLLDSYVVALCVVINDTLICTLRTHYVYITYEPCIPTMSEWGIAFLILIFFFLISFWFTFNRIITFADLKQYTNLNFWYSELLPLAIKYSFILPIICVLILIYWNEFTSLDLLGTLVSYTLIVINIHLSMQYSSKVNRINNSSSPSKLS